MSAHNILGKAGEDAAAKYLEQNAPYVTVTGERITLSWIL